MLPCLPLAASCGKYHANEQGEATVYVTKLLDRVIGPSAVAASAVCAVGGSLLRIHAIDMVVRPFGSPAKEFICNAEQRRSGLPNGQADDHCGRRETPDETDEDPEREEGLAEHARCQRQQRQDEDDHGGETEPPLDDPHLGLLQVFLGNLHCDLWGGIELLVERLDRTH